MPDCFHPDMENEKRGRGDEEKWSKTNDAKYCEWVGVQRTYYGVLFAGAGSFCSLVYGWSEGWMDIDFDLCRNDDFYAVFSDGKICSNHIGIYRDCKIGGMGYGQMPCLSGRDAYSTCYYDSIFLREFAGVEKSDYMAGGVV